MADYEKQDQAKVRVVLFPDLKHQKISKKLFKNFQKTEKKSKKNKKNQKNQKKQKKSKKI